MLQKVAIGAICTSHILIATMLVAKAYLADEVYLPIVALALSLIMSVVSIGVVVGHFVQLCKRPKTYDSILMSYSDAGIINDD